MDRLLVAGWLLASLAFVAAVGRELLFYAGSVHFNSMWESAPLQVAFNVIHGRPLYADWTNGPVHLAIYGPLFYQMLAGLAELIGADHAGLILIGRWSGIAWLGIALAGVVWFLRSHGGSWWAAMIAVGVTACLLSPTILRFVASARPDAMAVALSILGLTLTTIGGRASPGKRASPGRPVSPGGPVSPGERASSGGRASCPPLAPDRGQAPAPDVAPTRSVEPAYRVAQASRMAPASSVAPASRRCTFRRWLILLSGALLMSAAWLTKQTALAAPLTAILALMAGGHRASTGGGHPAPTGGGHPASTGGGHPARLYQQDAGATRGSRHSDPTGGGLRARLRGCQYPIILALLLLLFGAVAWTTLTLATDGWFNRHMQVVAAPSMRPHYTWYMLTRPPAEPQIPYLFILPVLAILTTILPGSGTALGGRPSCPTTPAKRRRHTGEQASYPPLAPDREQPLEGPLDQAEPLHIRALPVAILYFALSLAIALITAMHQGSDRNYLLEPALAAGLLAGAWADRVARVPLTRDWLLTRTAAAAALLSPMLLDLPDRFARTDADSRHQANSVSPYSDEALAWLRRLPEPMLCLDSWLAWRAGVANDLNDSVAYGSYVMTGRPDPITRRAENRHYACIVTMTPAGESADPLYGDIPSLWPGLRRALLEKYTLLSNHGPWHAYTPNTEALPPIGSQPDQAEPQRRRPEAGGPDGFGEEPINNLTETVTMNATSRARVLDVGQCNMDHSAIRSLITTRFDADVDRAHSIEEAIAAMRNSRYDLVLVNRILDADGREGLELIHQAQADEQLKTVPVMMVSNYADAQAAAVAAGARQGFGKSQLFEASTAEALARVLPGKPANVR